MGYCEAASCWHLSPCPEHGALGPVEPFTEFNLPLFISKDAGLSAYLGGSPSDWKVLEVGDGNLNFVFIIHGSANSICVKQSVPYIRKFPTFSLAQGRIGFEHRHLQEEFSRVPQHVPKPLAFFPASNCLVMEYLGAHTILRGEMIKRKQFPHLAEHLADYLAQTLFFTSDFGLASSDKRMLHQGFAANHPMCKITQEAIFTCPYEAVSSSFPNNCAEPLKDMHAAILADSRLKLRVSELKHLFLSSAEALIHADLHTGSVMVSATETRVIDGEFAFAGPMAFDIGLLLGNLFMNYFSQPSNEEGDVYRNYVLHTIVAIWALFKEKWLRLWNARLEGKKPGDGFPSSLLEPEKCADTFFKKLLQDSLGFAGCEMIRRTVGVAHVDDLDKIEDVQQRTLVQYANVRFARWLICYRPSWEHVIKQLPLALPAAKLCSSVANIQEVAALVLVAKFPIAGSSKTRIAKDLGGDWASQFSMACLKDLLHRFAEFHDEHGQTDNVLLFAPPEAEQKFLDMLTEEKLQDSWKLQPMIQGDLRASDLGSKLSQARSRLVQKGYGPVMFIGSDCPDLPFATVSGALQACRGIRSGFPQAYISPVTDGGYALVGVPSSAADQTFESIEWSSSRTCVHQIRQLSSQQFEVVVGPFLSDVDDIDDIKTLQERRQQQKEIVCPRVDAFISGLPPWPEK